MENAPDADPEVEHLAIRQALVYSVDGVTKDDDQNSSEDETDEEVFEKGKIAERVVEQMTRRSSPRPTKDEATKKKILHVAAVYGGSSEEEFNE